MPRTLVGSRIRERREAIGLKQSEVARLAQISPSYLNLIEHNRRGIAGKVLINIAQVLALDVSTLLDGADSELIRSLQTAAANSGAKVELDRVEELVSRFPGWARLIAGLQQRASGLQQSVDALSDRLTHDPFLAESLHEMLSSVTAIHATSGILADAREMQVLQQRRFQANIHDESTRLSDLSQGLVNYFDKLSEGEQSLSTPLDEAEAFLGRHKFHFEALETPDAAVAKAMIASSPDLISQAARMMVANLLTQYGQGAENMPLSEFLNTAQECGFNTTTLARRFRVPLAAVHRRLAFLPQQAGLPEFGLIVCDGTGAVLLRKPLPGFALPRYASACALWPLYQALNRPHAPVVAVLETTEQRRFRAEAQSAYLDMSDAVGDSDTLPVVQSSMLFRSLRLEESQREAMPASLVGTSCRICPRETCPARREPSIHAAHL